MSRLRIAAVMGLSLTIALLFWSQWWMTPVRLFVTLLHESGHAFFCLVTGGTVTGLRIHPDGSGLTLTNPMPGTGFLVQSGGYIGSALFGSLLIYLSTVPFVRRFLHHLLGLIVVTMTVFYVGDVFTLVFAIALAGFLFFGVDRLSESLRQDFFLGLGTMTGVFALLDIRNLFLFSEGTVGGKPSMSDAQALQSMTGIPAIVWASAWGLVALWCLWQVTRRVFAPPPAPIDTPESDSYS